MEVKYSNKFKKKDEGLILERFKRAQMTILLNSLNVTFLIE
jgi:hypothetical protein